MRGLEGSEDWRCLGARPSYVGPPASRKPATLGNLRRRPSSASPARLRALGRLRRASNKEHLDRFDETDLGQWHSIKAHAEQLHDDVAINTDELRPRDGPAPTSASTRKDSPATSATSSTSVGDNDGVDIFEK